MDIFISHSWKDKVFARKLARDLEGVGNIWIDHQKKKPGQEIGADMREVIEGADAFILVWSRQAKKDERVQQEIDLALASGIPVVQPESGAFPEIINLTGGGLLYKPDQTGSLVHSLALLLKDPARARELGKHGRKSIGKHFNPDNMAAKMVEVYKKVM